MSTSLIYFPEKEFLKNTQSLLKMNCWVTLASFSSKCSVIRDPLLTKVIHKLIDSLKILTDLQFDSLCEPDPQFFLHQALRALLFHVLLTFFCPSFSLALLSLPCSKTVTVLKREVVILSYSSNFPTSLTSGLSSLYLPSLSCFTCSVVLVWLRQIYLLILFLYGNRKSTFPDIF